MVTRDLEVLSILQRKSSERQFFCRDRLLLVFQSGRQGECFIRPRVQFLTKSISPGFSAMNHYHFKALAIEMMDESLVVFADSVLIQKLGQTSHPDALS